MPPLGVSANADGTDNVLRQLIHEQPKRPDRSPQRCARALADANEPGCIARSHAVAWLKFKKRARSGGHKNAFDFKAIDAESSGAGSGICRPAAYFMSDSLTNRAVHKKRSVAYFASRMRALGTARLAMAAEITSLTMPFAASLRFRPHSRSWAS